MKVKFFIKEMDCGMPDIIRSGELKVKKWNDLELFRAMQLDYDEDEEIISKDDFEETYEVVKTDEVMLMLEVDGNMEYAFIKVS